MEKRETVDEAIDRIIGNTTIFTLDEIKDMVEYDRKIDKASAKDRLEHDLSLEDEKAAKKLANATTRKPAVYKFDKKKQKAENLDKKGIISLLLAVLAENECQVLEVTNPEREFLFLSKGVKYKITLACPRK